MRSQHDLASSRQSTPASTRRFLPPLLCAALLTGASSRLAATDLFNVSANTTSGAPMTGFESTNSFITLLEDVADTRSQLNNFDNTNFKGTIRYAGVNNAATFQLNLVKTDASGNPLPQTAHFTFASGHAPVTFVSATSSDLKNQIVAFFRSDGTAVLSSLNSPVGVSDGNPNAVTATAANTTFTAFGTTAINRAGAPDLDFSFFNPLNIDISSFEAGGFNGYRISVPVGLTYHIPHLLDDRISLQLTGLFTYINIESADIYQGGGFLGIPIQLIRRHALAAAAPAGKDGKDGKAAPVATGFSRWSWTVTPNGGAVVSGSVQFAEGGIIYLGGLTSAVSYDFTDRITITLGDSFTVAEGGSLDVGNYHFNDQTDQVILKNGFSLSYRLTDRVALEAQALSTNFTNGAAIPAYATFALQTVYNLPLGHTGRVAVVARIGFITDQAPDYHSYGGRLSLGLSF